MHRVSRVVRPSHRALSSLQPSPRPLRPDPRPPLELYEDDLLNELYTPDLPTSHTLATTKRPSPSRMQDATFYGPALERAYNRQLALEQETVDEAVERFRKMTHDASSRGDVTTHRSANDLLLAWYNPFILAMRAIQQPSAHRAPPRSGRRSISEEVSQLLSLLPPESLAVIVVHTLLSALMRDSNGLPLTRAACVVADAVRAEINMKKLIHLHKRHEDNVRKSSQLPSLHFEPQSPRVVLERAKKSSASLASAVNFAAAQVDDREASWSIREQLLLGTKLIDVFMSIAKVKDASEKFVPAITHTIRFRKASRCKVGILHFTEAAEAALKQEAPSLTEYVHPKQQPMVVPPRPWTSPNDGAYLRCNSFLVKRIPGSQREIDKLLQSADLTELFEGLNVLGSQHWTVNRSVLDAAQTLWDKGGGRAGLVTKTNFDVPERKTFLEAELSAFEKRKMNRELFGPRDGDEEDSEQEEFDEKRALRKLRGERRRARKHNRELVSLRADTEHRMRQAQRFSGEEKIWLPHNVDFRGRAYPMPVHLQHMGCDLTRALLTFGKPGVMLGERGVYWLKVHLANLLGGDKLSFDERIELAEDNMEKAVRVGRDPLSDSNLEWWSEAEDPFQLLAACSEVAEASGRYGGERAMEMFESTLPVSMDGSCNGLQHYAALGRDVEGGEQVNLVPNERPQDVYTGIANRVGEQVAQLAREGDEFGLLMDGKVSRKVVKQTVMTSVYGVTPIGARQQIMNRLAEIPGFPEEQIFGTASKLARLTLSSLGDIFRGASETMDWLYGCARRISKSGHKVEWTTPVGLPVMQPYRRSERNVVRTLMQRVTLSRTGEHTPVSMERQRSAFPPNFVHSIDSAHMLYTAMGCRDAGLNFAAVHDSFWTNAAHVDVMHRVLREEFIELHERDLLRELRESFLLRYDGVELETLPPRGDLDLSVVRRSPYFFS